MFICAMCLFSASSYLYELTETKVTDSTQNKDVKNKYSKPHVGLCMKHKKIIL